MALRWSSIRREMIENPKVDRFLAEIEEICKEHGFSIGHEDSGGGFIIYPYNCYVDHPGDDRVLSEWLQAASDSTQ